MSTAQILTELPHLSHSDRREIARHLIGLEQEAQTLADCDARADASFQGFDALESYAGTAQSFLNGSRR